MKLLTILTALLLLASTAFAVETHFDSRIGVTLPHNEGSVIARYINENELSAKWEHLELIGGLDLYFTQDWQTNVHEEKDVFTAIDDVRMSYEVEGRWWFNDNLAVYGRQFSPIDKQGTHSKSGDGWHRMQYRLDVGVMARWW